METLVGENPKLKRMREIIDRMSELNAEYTARTQVGGSVPAYMELTVDQQEAIDRNRQEHKQLEAEMLRIMP
jgi:hypothetical protein